MLIRLFERARKFSEGLCGADAAAGGVPEGAEDGGTDVGDEVAAEGEYDVIPVDWCSRELFLGGFRARDGGGDEVGGVPVERILGRGRERGGWVRWGGTEDWVVGEEKVVDGFGEVEEGFVNAGFFEDCGRAGGFEEGEDIFAFGTVGVERGFSGSDWRGRIGIGPGFGFGCPDGYLMRMVRMVEMEGEETNVD